MSHGLSDEFFDALQHGPLGWLREYVRTDHTLNLEIREEQIQVYYRGGRLMYVKHRGRGFPSTFDRKYVCGGRPMPCDIPPDAGLEKNWQAALPLLKREMDLYFSTTKAGAEREFQQTLARENNCGRLAGSTDYLICSTEYQSHLGRFDAVGVHWPSSGPCRKEVSRLPLTLIEIKYGDNAIVGKCGLEDHLRDFTRLAKNREELESLCKEMKLVLQQKQRLGLIQGAKREVESISAERLQVLLVLANTDAAAGGLTTSLAAIQDRPFPLFPGGVWIARASQFAAGLFHDRNLSISDFRHELAEQKERGKQWDRRFRQRMH